MTLILPGAEDRTIAIGQTGSGKTVLLAWLLSRQRFDRRPWVLIDFKNETLWDEIGTPPLRRLSVNDMPGKRGLYRLRVSPWEDHALERWLERIWERENCGLLVDEASLMPKREAFKAILRQGRSKLLPVLAGTQRPVDCDREIFTEAQYRALFGIEDVARDYPIIKGLFGSLDVRKMPPRHWCYWWDAKRRTLETLQPVPDPFTIAARLRKAVPYSWTFGGR